MRVGCACHGEGSAPAGPDEECASGGHLAGPAHVPAFVPWRWVMVLEVGHSQGDLPAARGSVLTSDRLAGGGSEADRLARRGGRERDYDFLLDWDGLGRSGPASAE